MRRLRVTAAMRRQLDDLRARRSSSRAGGIMLVPAVLSCDEWERLASAQQAALMAASSEDRARPPDGVISVEETTDQAAERAHRESEVLFQQIKRDEPKAIRDYLDAQAKARGGITR